MLTTQTVSHRLPAGAVRQRNPTKDPVGHLNLKNGKATISLKCEHVCGARQNRMPVEDLTAAPFDHRRNARSRLEVGQPGFARLAPSPVRGRKCPHLGR
jgi:hypothetical protein